MSVVEVRLYENRRLINQWQAETPLVLGRQDVEYGEPSLGPCQNLRCGAKLVVAPERANRVPRYVCRIASDECDRLVIENIHAKFPVVVQAREHVQPGETKEFEMPAVILLGVRAVRVGSPNGTEDGEASNYFRSLVSEPIDPNALTLHEFAHKARALAPDTVSTASSSDVVELLQLVLPVIREAANTDAFYTAAVNATIRIAKLDRAIVFSIDDSGNRRLRVEQFRVRDAVDSSTSSLAETAPAISDTIVCRLLREVKTQIYDNAQPSDDSNAPSLRQIHQVVAAPILGKKKEIIGILYGDRWTYTTAASHHLDDVEAKLVEILAGAIAAGVARLEEEEQRSRMSGFFSEVVAKQLAEDPKLLDAKEADVTVMFCDVRRFSPISKNLGPVRTIQWMHDVLDEVSQCIVETGGVLINYVGDEVVAMWGAPHPYDDHASRSLQSAAAILRAVAALDQRWRERLGEPLKVGIGINSGPAAVGNTGSRLKFQYGIYGDVVNTASRLQSATKQFSVDCLVAAPTLERSSQPLPKRRLATISMVGIEEPVQVWELRADVTDGWEQLVHEYEAALAAFEKLQFEESARRLGELLKQFSDDQPSRRLLSRAVSQISEPDSHFSHVDKLTTK